MTKFMAIPLLVLAMAIPVLASSPGILVSNEKLSVSAVNKDGRVLVPLRAIFESLNATVNYDAASKTITGNQDGKIIILKINDKVVSVDGQQVTLDVPASIIKCSTLVPVRFIGESLGASVGWANNTVLINSDEQATTPVPAKNTKETLSQKNAVKKGQSYLDYTSFSNKGLIEQLEFEGFSKADATYAVTKLNINEQEQAVKKGKSYLDYSAFSRSGLIEQLEFEGFSNQAATYAVDQIGL